MLTMCLPACLSACLPPSLVGHQAVAVNAALEYCVVETGDSLLVMALPLADKLRALLLPPSPEAVTGTDEWAVLGTCLGGDLVGTCYRHPLQPVRVARVVEGGEYITADSGTG